MSNLSVMQNGRILDLEFSTYPDGTENLKEIKGLTRESCYLNVKIKDPNRDLMRIALAKQALDYQGVKQVTLNCPYIPHGRADRVFKGYAGTPLRAFSNLINSLNFREVITTDPHSQATLDLIDNVKTYNLAIKAPEDVVICAPDQGAIERASEAAKINGCVFISCIKHRDIQTGVPTITEIDSPVDPKGQTVLIVDDICDGGGTFIALAKELKKAGFGEIRLHVTHGIFSKGLKVFEGVIDNVNCHSIVGGNVNCSHILDFNSKADR